MDKLQQLLGKVNDFLFTHPWSNTVRANTTPTWVAWAATRAVAPTLPVIQPTVQTSVPTPLLNSVPVSIPNLNLQTPAPISINIPQSNINTTWAGNIETFWLTPPKPISFNDRIRTTQWDIIQRAIDEWVVRWEKNLSDIQGQLQRAWWNTLFDQVLWFADRWLDALWWTIARWVSRILPATAPLSYASYFDLGKVQSLLPENKKKKILSDEREEEKQKQHQEVYSWMQDWADNIYRNIWTNVHWIKDNIQLRWNQAKNSMDFSNQLVWEFDKQLWTYVNKMNDMKEQALFLWNQELADRIVAHTDWVVNTVFWNTEKLLTISETIRKNNPWINEYDWNQELRKELQKQWYQWANDVMTQWLTFFDSNLRNDSRANVNGREAMNLMTYQDFLNTDSSNLETEYQHVTWLPASRGWVARILYNDTQNSISPWFNLIARVAWEWAALALPPGLRPWQFARADLGSLSTRTMWDSKRSWWDGINQFGQTMWDYGIDAIPVAMSFAIAPTSNVGNGIKWLKYMQDASKTIWAANKLQIAKNIWLWFRDFAINESIIDTAINANMQDRAWMGSFEWSVYWWALSFIMDFRKLAQLSKLWWEWVRDWINAIARERKMSEVVSRETSKWLDITAAQEVARREVDNMVATGQDIWKVDISPESIKQYDDLHKLVSDWIANQNAKYIQEYSSLVRQAWQATWEESQRLLWLAQEVSAQRKRFNDWIKMEMTADTVLKNLLTKNDLSTSQAQYIWWLLRAAENPSMSWMDIERLATLQTDDAARRVLRDNISAATWGRTLDTVDWGVATRDFLSKTGIDPARLYTEESLIKASGKAKGRFADMFSMNNWVYEYFTKANINWQDVYEMNTAWLTKLNAEWRPTLISTADAQMWEEFERFQNVIDKNKWDLDITDTEVEQLWVRENFETLLTEVNKFIPCIV